MPEYSEKIKITIEEREPNQNLVRLLDALSISKGIDFSVNDRTYKLTGEPIRASRQGAYEYNQPHIKGGSIILGKCAVLGFSEEFWNDYGKLSNGVTNYTGNRLSPFYRDYGLSDNTTWLPLFSEWLEYYFNDIQNSFKVCLAVFEDANKIKGIVKIKAKTRGDYKKFICEDLPLFEECKSFATFKTHTYLHQLFEISPYYNEKLRAFIESDLTPAYEDSMRYNRKIHDELGLPAMYETVKSWI